jgi:hypothetical protein
MLALVSILFVISPYNWVHCQYVIAVGVSIDKRRLYSILVNADVCMRQITLNYNNKVMYTNYAHHRTTTRWNYNGLDKAEAVFRC